MNFMEKYVKGLIKYKNIITLSGIIFAFTGAYLTSKIPLETDIAKLLPSSVKSARILRNIKEKYGGLGNVVFVIESEDFKASVEFAKALQKKLKAEGKVLYSAYGPDKSLYEKYGLLFLPVESLKKLKKRVEEKIREVKVKESPFFFDLEDEKPQFDIEELIEEFVPASIRDNFNREYYTDKNKKILLLFVQPSVVLTDMKKVNKYLKEMRNIVDDLNPGSFQPSMKVSIGGTFRNRADEYNTIIRDIKRSAVTTFILIFVFLSFFFNQLSSLIIILVPLIESILITSGMAYIIIGRLNFISAFLFAVLLGLGVDFGIHLLSRYFEERGRGVEEALVLTLKKTFASCLVSAITTSFSLFFLIFFKFKGFSEFGIISAIGVVISFICYYVFFPPLIAILENFKFIKNKTFKTSKKIAGFILRNSQVVFVVCLIIISVTLYFASHLKMEDNFSSLRANLPSTKLVKEKIGKIIKLSESPAIVLTSSFEETRKVEQRCKEKMKEKESTIQACFSLATLVPENQKERLKIIEGIDGLIDNEFLKTLKGEQRKKVERFKKMLSLRNSINIKDIPQNILQRFTDNSGKVGTVGFIYPSVGLVHVSNALKFKKDILDIRTGSGKVFHGVNDNIVFADLYVLVIKETKILSALVLFLILIITVLGLRDLRYGVLANLPLWLGLVGGLGSYTAVFGDLNIFNLIVIPVLLGIGIDNSIHITKRFMDCKNVEETLSFTGTASFYTTFTTIIGFGGLATAYHRGLRSIGDLAIVGLFVLLLCTVVFYPVILKNLERRDKNN